MKRSTPLTMEGRIQQARRNVLRGHKSGRHGVEEAHYVCASMTFEMVLLLMISFTALHGDARSLSEILFFRIAPLILAYFAILRYSIALKEESWKRPTPRYQEALEFLTGTYDLRAIGPLAEAYWLRNIPSIVPGALTRLLRVQLQMQVSVALSDRQRRCLYRILTRQNHDDIDLQLAILDFLETFGDVRALPAVRTLAEEETRPPRLHTAALRCYAALQTQQAELAGRKTLLRGAHTPTPPPEQLLHPVLLASDSQPEQLLRATMRKDEG